MLFTQATEAGIQLENALILSPEQYVKAQIPANNKRILAWAKDNHVNVTLGVQRDSDFNCILGVMMDDRVSDNTMAANKKLLNHLGRELPKFIDDMSENVDEANKDAETSEKLKELIENFGKDVRTLCGEDTMVAINVFQIDKTFPREFLFSLAKLLTEHE